MRSASETIGDPEVTLYLGLIHPQSDRAKEPTCIRSFSDTFIRFELLTRSPRAI
jgi:hypothetical protein